RRHPGSQPRPQGRPGPHPTPPPRPLPPRSHPKPPPSGAEPQSHSNRPPRDEAPSARSQGVTEITPEALLAVGPRTFPKQWPPRATTARDDLSHGRNPAPTLTPAIASGGRFERSQNLIAQRAPGRVGAMQRSRAEPVEGRRSSA